MSDIRTSSWDERSQSEEINEVTEEKSAQGDSTYTALRMPDRSPKPNRGSKETSQPGTPNRSPQRRYSMLEDVLGPVGHGPSSSHTIAPHLAAREAHEMVGGTPETADVWLVNSMATTGEGHGTPVAIAGGLMGLEATDPRTADALTAAEQIGLDVVFHKVTNDDLEHPNTIYMRLQRGGFTLHVKVVSIGGGNYEINANAPLPTRLRDETAGSTKRRRMIAALS